MTAVNFYHIERRGLEEAVAGLLVQAQARGMRVMVRGPDAGVLRHLDDWLWQYPDDSFLPHAFEGGRHDADQPVLIGQGAAANGARAVMWLGGSVIDLDEAARLERCWLLFEAADAAQLAAARTEWRRVREAGFAAEYWSDASGRWERGPR